MATSSYTSDPIDLGVGEDGETVARVIETIRGLAWPRLVVTIEGDSATEVYERVAELNEELRSFSSIKIPMPDVCPTCGKAT